MKKKAKKAAKKNTALAIRRPVARMRIDDPHGMLASKMIDRIELGELAHTGGVGLGEVTLTKHERTVIARPVNRGDVMLLPSGIAYLPHLYYTRWLNEAFGPTGWALSPAARPTRIENLVIQDFIFYIHRVPVAYVRGGAEYHEKNKRQNYDDVLESTFAFGLRRSCKRIGMALELWDKRWLHAFLEAEGIQVNVKGRDGVSKQWRRRTDPPLPGEVGKGSKGSADTVHVGEVVDAEPAGGDGNGREKITHEQVKRLVGIWRHAGRADTDVQLWLRKRYGYKATKDIKRFDYSRIEKELTARGELTLPGDGE